MSIAWDIAGLVWFLGCWTAYSHFADFSSPKSANLFTVMNAYRREWMRRMLKRENRIVDITLIGNLLRSISFFANTSVLILFGIVTLFSYRENASMLLETIPYASVPTPLVMEIKIFTLMIIFIYAFFKFTWSLRQYNYACIVVGAAPAHDDLPEDFELYAQRGERLISNAAKHFNMGLRAYYFGLAALSWFINAPIFMAVTAFVIFVIYRREFRSHTLNNLLQWDGKE